MTITLGALLGVGVAALGVISGGVGPGGPPSAPPQETERSAAGTGPLALPPVPAPRAGSPECGAVLEALPSSLLVDDSRVPRRQLADPAPPATVAWGDAEHEPMTVRCGITDPAELTRTSPLVEISGVAWLRMDEADTTTWLAVDRPVRVALNVPSDSGSGPVQDLSRILRDTLPERDVFG